MSAQTAPASSNPADGPKFEIVNRLDGVPAVHDTIAYAQSWIQATSLTASLYATAVGVANKSYEIATPVLTKTKPLLESVDGLAVATFDRAEATFPYPFKTPTQDLIIVKQARGIYGATVQPVIETAQPLVADVYNKTVSINTYLIQRAEQTVSSSGDLGHNLVEQLKHLASHGKELPSELIAAVTQTSHDLKEIVFDKDITLGDKSNRVSAYVVDKVKPIVDEVYNYVLGAKKKAEEQAQATAQSASETVDQVTQDAQS